MGQYHYVVNLDRREFLHPHKLGCGLKLWEQIANSPGIGAGLIVLLASASNSSGGGDLGKAEIVGQWRGDRIAFVGDYDDQSSYVVADVGKRMTGQDIYRECSDRLWNDVTDAVCDVLESELDGKFKGDGWRDFVYNDVQIGVR